MCFYTFRLRGAYRNTSVPPFLPPSPILFVPHLPTLALFLSIPPTLLSPFLPSLTPSLISLSILHSLTLTLVLSLLHMLTHSLSSSILSSVPHSSLVVHFFNSSNGKEIGDGHVFKHHCEVMEVALNQKGQPEDRQLAYMDKNYDLYLLPVRNAHTGWNIVHIGSMVTTMAWNDEANILAAMQDGRFTVWYHPAVVYTDPDLLQKTVLRKEGSEFSKNPLIVNFTGNHCTLRRSDGAVISTSISPFPAVLHNQERPSAGGSLEGAVRLCRFVKDSALWAVLAGMAAESKDLNTAEIAYAAISEVHKVQHLQFVKGMSSMERRNAEMALFCKQPRQAETVYLQANMIYRAIQLNIQLYNWERALELAVKHKTHVDTVLGFRQKYLNEIGSEENLKRFRQFADKITVDWEKIQVKVEAEEEREAQDRP
jgi:intraflagellar transport protein 80